MTNDKVQSVNTFLDTEYAGLDDKETIARLKRHVLRLQDSEAHYYATKMTSNKTCCGGHGRIPVHGISAAQAKEQLVQITELDNRPRLNTSSYVNVVLEKEEQEVAVLGLAVNLADGSVYPSSTELQDNTIDAVAKLWNCPKPEESTGHFAGSGTVGSTEACLLALLAHKMRWRLWYQERHGLTEDQYFDCPLIHGPHFPVATVLIFRVQSLFVQVNVFHFSLIAARCLWYLQNSGIPLNKPQTTLSHSSTQQILLCL